MAMSFARPVKIRIQMASGTSAACWLYARRLRDGLALLAGATVLAWVVVTFSR